MTVFSFLPRPLLRLLGLLVLVSTITPTIEAQEQRLALVLGSSTSSGVDVPNLDDGLAFRETLRELGFTIVNPGKQESPTPIGSSSSKELSLSEQVSSEAEILVVSVHGLGVVDNVGSDAPGAYLSIEPKWTDGSSPQTKDPRTELPIEKMIDQLFKSPARVKLLVLDLACEDQESCLSFQAVLARVMATHHGVENTVILSNCVPRETMETVGETYFIQQLKRGIQGCFEAGEGVVQAGEAVKLRDLQSYLRAFASQEHSTLNSRSFRVFGRCEEEVAVSRIPVAPMVGGVEMVHVPGGKFLRGSRMFLCPTEQPVRAITISKPFYVSKYELTVSQVLRWLNDPEVVFDSTWINLDDADGPIRLSDGRFVLNPKFKSSKIPVFDLSWSGAAAFCAWCSSQDDVFSYRLPTEAEWEYVARAGSATEFPFGDQCNGTEANIDGTQPFGTVEVGPDRWDVMEVGSFPANTWGIFDTVGNVSEWCQDLYDLEYYRVSPARDPLSLQGIARIRRGGDFHSRAMDARSSFRNAEVRHLLQESDGIGARIVAVRRSVTAQALEK